MATLLAPQRTSFTTPGFEPGFPRREAEREGGVSCVEGTRAFSVEEVFDRIDRKFVGFYGEYGRKIVNARRAEWSGDGVVNLEPL